MIADVSLSIDMAADAVLTVAGDGETALTVETPYIGGGTTDYGRLRNKPQIEEVELVGNRELDEFGMGIASLYDIAMLFN